MSEEIMMYIFYFIYYIVFPFGILIPILILWRKKDFIKGISEFGMGREEQSSSLIKKNLRSTKKLQVFLVIFLLIFIPMMNFTSSNLVEVTMARERVYFGGLGHSRLYNPVESQIGPRFDANSVIEEMNRDPDYWYMDDIQEQIDFDEITRMPGRMGAYYLDKRGWSHIVITYTYFSPLPMTRIYAFRIYDRIAEDEAILEVEDTIIYPMDPANTDPF